MSWFATRHFLREDDGGKVHLIPMVTVYVLFFWLHAACIDDVCSFKSCRSVPDASPLSLLAAIFSNVTLLTYLPCSTRLSLTKPRSRHRSNRNANAGMLMSKRHE